MAGGPVALEPGDCELKRALGPMHLIALGIGAIIGAVHNLGLKQGGHS